MPSFSRASRAKLSTVDHRLQTLFSEVIKHFDCTVTCGLRTTHEQQTLYAQGRTMPGQIVTQLDGVIKKSRHQSGLAVDVVPWPIDWRDKNRFYHLAGFVRGMATLIGIDVVWGGDWDGDFTLDDQSFYDLPHWEIKT